MIEHVSDDADFANVFIFATLRPNKKENLNSELISIEMLIDNLKNETSKQ